MLKHSTGVKMIVTMRCYASAVYAVVMCLYDCPTEQLTVANDESYDG